jgi:hypothetical protein
MLVAVTFLDGTTPESIIFGTTPWRELGWCAVVYWTSKKAENNEDPALETRKSRISEGSLRRSVVRTGLVLRIVCG